MGAAEYCYLRIHQWTKTHLIDTRNFAFWVHTKELSHLVLKERAKMNWTFSTDNRVWKKKVLKSILMESKSVLVKQFNSLRYKICSKRMKLLFFRKMRELKWKSCQSKINEAKMMSGWKEFRSLAFANNEQRAEHNVWDNAS